MNNLNQPIFDAGEGIYIVEEGDTLYSVAKKFGVSPRAIAVDNQIDKELFVGQFLYVLRRGNTYVVQVEDTFEKIAKNFGVSPNDIKKLNKIEYLYPGEIIDIKTNDYDKF